MKILSKTPAIVLCCIMSGQMQMNAAVIPLSYSFNQKKDYTLLWLILTFSILIILILSVIFLLLKKNRDDKILKKTDDNNNNENESETEIMRCLALELKNPLTMIYNPVKRLIDSGEFEGKTLNTLNGVVKQAERITQMVNVVLDGKNNGITSKGINPERICLNEWIENLINSYRIRTDSRRFRVLFQPNKTIEYAFFDKEIVSEAFYSVIDYIMDYSRSGSTIRVLTSNKKGYFEIIVECRDNILPADTEKIFLENPYKSIKKEYEENLINLPSARVKMNLMGGDIYVKNGPGETGAVFRIKFPDSMESEITIQESVRPYNHEKEEAERLLGEPDDFDTKNATLLIADDHRELLDYLKNEFRPYFKNVYTAIDGKEALESVNVKMPNIIISDIMMPRMNGFDLCRKIKENPELSHIPIILLTSRTDPINQKLGYKIGADAYMAKPFDLRIMYKLICSQLKNRQEIKKLYAGSFFTSLTENINYTPADEQFIIKLNNIIKENLDNSDLDAQFLVDKLCISRTSLFNKMNSLLGVPVAKYIRRMRIEAAKNLLVNTDKQINNVALCTGFAESQYFSTVFKQETGMTPTQYKQEHAKKRRIENKVNP